MGDIARSAAGEATLLPHRTFTAEGGAYLYAAETGGLFRMDDGARDALSALASAGAGGVPAEILSDLRRAGLLGTSHGGGPAGPTAHPPLRLRTLVLMLTYSCNLACRYCYEDREEGCVPPATGGGSPREMSPESVRENVRFLLDHSGENRRVSIVLFGGEPLLRFPLLRDAVHDARAMASARGKEISFSLTTNGTLVTR
ncbi:MAG TPA: radical SAM protein, partial [Candidatus Deferrimicrobiaceae bacterium]